RFSDLTIGVNDLHNVIQEVHTIRDGFRHKERMLFTFFQQFAELPFLKSTACANGVDKLYLIFLEGSIAGCQGNQVSHVTSLVTGSLVFKKACHISWSLSRFFSKKSPKSGTGKKILSSGILQNKIPINIKIALINTEVTTHSSKKVLFSRRNVRQNGKKLTWVS